MSKEVEVLIKYVGIDSWNRPIFKSANSYYGSVNTLFPNKNIAPNDTNEEIIEYFKNNINELEYFGDEFDCEPNGGLNKCIKLKIV